jgi:hypothetical protein
MIARPNTYTAVTAGELAALTAPQHGEKSAAATLERDLALDGAADDDEATALAGVGAEAGGVGERGLESVFERRREVARLRLSPGSLRRSLR